MGNNAISPFEGGIMQLHQFMKVLEKHFEYKIIPIEGTINDADRLFTFFGAFIYEPDDDSIPFYRKKTESLRKYYSGHDALPKDCADYYLSRLNIDAFTSFCDDIEDDVVQNLIDDFAEYGISISPLNYCEDIFEVFKAILTDIAEKEKKTKVRYAKVISTTQVQVGKKVINIPQILDASPDIREDETPYVNALLQVYAIDSKVPVEEITLDSLTSMSPMYQTHLRLQRINYYKADAVFHLLRDTFSDGQIEFDSIKAETLGGIQSCLFGHYSSPFDMVNETLKHVTLLTYGKSFLGGNNNGFVGAEEKQGIVHMLVNDGKIVWVK